MKAILDTIPDSELDKMLAEERAKKRPAPVKSQPKKAAAVKSSSGSRVTTIQEKRR